MDGWNVHFTGMHEFGVGHFRRQPDLFVTRLGTRRNQKVHQILMAQVRRDVRQIRLKTTGDSKPSM